MRADHHTGEEPPAQRPAWRPSLRRFAPAGGTRRPSGGRRDPPRLGFDLFAIDLERLHGGAVGHGEQDAVAARGVLVAVPVPGRDDEDVALLPLEALAFDLGGAIA